MAIHLLNPADFKGTFFAHILTIGLNIASAIILRINDVRDLARKYAPTPCAILDFNRLPHHHRPVNQLLNGHSAPPHQKNNYPLEGTVNLHSFH